MNEEEVPDRSNFDSEDEEELQQPPVKKKWSASEQREWTEVNRWDRTDNSDEDILLTFAKNLMG